MDKEYVLVYTPYITRKGVRIWASQIWPRRCSACESLAKSIAAN